MRSSKLIAALFGMVWFAAQAAPGDLDLTFGTGGSVMTNIRGTDAATSVAIQADGKIVVAGHCKAGLVICVARYSSDGALDTSFGGSSGTAGSIDTAVNTGKNKASGVVIQVDGKIVVSGTCDRPSASAPGGFNQEFCLIRYTASGALDTSFNATGIVQIPVGINGADLGNAVALQSDGKIVVVGACGAPFIPGSLPDDMCIARFTTAGALDTSFNGTGKVVTAVKTDSDGAYSVVIQVDGKIVVGGGCGLGTLRDLCIVRYNTSGLLDTSFNTTGIRVIPMGVGVATAFSLALQSDGKFVLAGSCANGSGQDFCMARVTSSGALDTTFNTTGKVITAVGSGDNEAHKVVIDADGKILLAGHCIVSGSAFTCLARYTSDGVLDTSFQNAGKLIASLNGNSDVQRGMVLQTDGKIVVVGNSGNDFLISRYEGTPPPCRLDIDGDGLVLATTDSLIHSRIAFGMFGNAVTSGIGFPTSAKRKTWADIRAYLVTSCGMILPP